MANKRNDYSEKIIKSLQDSVNSLIKVNKILTQKIIELSSRIEVLEGNVSTGEEKRRTENNNVAFRANNHL